MGNKIIYRVIAGLALLLAAVFLRPDNRLFAALMFAVPYLLVGYDILLRAGANIVRGQVFDENLLMSIATLGAFAVGEYPEAVGVMLFYQAGELVSSLTADKSRRSIAKLMDIRPERAFVERGGTLKELPPEDVEIGELIAVPPGEKIPLDGVVAQGVSFVDTSAITGESVPRGVSAGSEVLSGFINRDGLLKIRVGKTYTDSTVTKILELVEDSASKKARRERFITQFARVYTPAVVAAAAALAILPPLITGENLAAWGYRALIFLVVSCPCALVISVPLAFFGAIGGASRQGILIKGGSVIESLAAMEIAAFDKTGTLTSGKLSVVGVYPSGGLLKEELLFLAAHSEGYSTHPVSKAITAAYGGKINAGIVSDVTETPGAGIYATVGGKTVLVGGEKLMSENKIKTENRCPGAGISVYIAVDGLFAGQIHLSDGAKPDAAGVIKELRALGVKKTVMLSGDREENAESTARALGIDEVWAELLPSDKVKIIERYIAGKNRASAVVYVGDGINDAPVLARANVGIAMGGFGSAAAIEAADAVIMTDELSKIPLAIKLSRRALAIAKQNIVMALGVKAAVLILGAFGVATMWEAVFADVGVTLLTVMNSMRTQRRVRREKAV